MFPAKNATHPVWSVKRDPVQCIHNTVHDCFTHICDCIPHIGENLLDVFPCRIPVGRKCFLNPCDDIAEPSFYLFHKVKEELLDGAHPAGQTIKHALHNESTLRLHDFGRRSDLESRFESGDEWSEDVVYNPFSDVQ